MDVALLQQPKIWCIPGMGMNYKGESDRNHKRMQYPFLSSLGIPIESWAMEIAIRRGVILRLKGASIYWRKETAEAMLLLHFFTKAANGKC